MLLSTWRKSHLKSHFPSVLCAIVLALGSSSSAHAFTCANCANEVTTQSSFREVNVNLVGLTTAFRTGVERIVGAIQGAATSQTTATSEAARIIAEAGAKVATDMAKVETAIKYEHLDPCSVTAVARGGDAVVTQRPAGSGRGSGGGGAAASAGATPAMKDALDFGAGRRAAPPPEIAAAVTVKGACGTFAQGGIREQGCKNARFAVGVSSGLPNADIKAETLMDGPQTPADIAKGVTRKLTIAPGDSRERMAIAAFIHNLETPMDLRTLGPDEIDSLAGRNYMALRDSYDAAMSMATKPLRDQESLITANKATLPVLQQLLKGEDARFVSGYLGRVYPAWQRDGISHAELLQLEANRRYLNADWHVRMAAANERQLLAEMVQLQAVGNWMLVQLLERSQQQSILMGTTAGAVIRTEKLPQLVAAHKAARK
jgi:hypothetical protein